jgi:pimeloyl-ACP methyl ester carboxylesterase
MFFGAFRELTLRPHDGRLEHPKVVKRILRRFVKAIAAVALTVLIGVTALIGWLWLDHGRSTALPRPTGTYPVGRGIYDWVDDTRLNPYAPAAGTKQELAVWVWYPASVMPSSQAAEYLPDYWARAIEQHEGFVMGRLLSRDPRRVESHSWNDVDVSPQQLMYPVILLRAGGGALSSDYTALAEDLTSHGYVVVSFDAPYRTVITAFPDGRVMGRSAQSDFDSMAYAAAEEAATKAMGFWIMDARFVLDRLQQLNANDPAGRFKGKLNLEKVGIVGHSLGGATAAQFCHDDTRCKGGIDIDGIPFGSVVQDGLDQPFFFILSDHRKESGPEPRIVEAKMESIYNKLPTGKRWQVMIEGANHFTFSDQMFTKSPVLITALRTLGRFGTLDKRRGLLIAAGCVHTFFDVYLKGAPTDELKGLPSRYREIQPDFTKAFSSHP